MRAIYLVFIALGLAATGAASEFGCRRCVSCGGSCVLQVRPTTKTETCFDVECQEICIPAVRFPWDCGPARCGRTRVITRLTSEEREAPTCEYEWVNVCGRCGRPVPESSEGPIMPPPAPEPPVEAGGSEKESSMHWSRAIWPVKIAKK